MLRPSLQVRARSSHMFAEPLEMRTLLSASSLDPNFGTGGEVTAALGGVAPVSAQAVAGDVNGKVVVAAEDGRFADVLRYLPNGKPDSSFGTGGKQQIDLGVGQVAQSLSLALEFDGKILVAGNDFTSATHSNQAFIARLQTNGQLDPTFGIGGKMLVHLGADDGHYELATLATGKMVFAADGVGSLVNGSFVAERLNYNGTADTTFGVGGIATVNVTINSTLSGIAIQPDGKIVIGGAFHHNAASSIQLARLTVGGMPDTTFGTGGEAIGKDTAVTNNAIALQSDGRIIAAGVKGASSFYLQRFNAKGTIDTAFGGSDGVNTMFSGSKTGQINAVTVQSSGSIVAVGTVDGIITVARYTPTGKLDSTFGTNGIVKTTFGANTTDAANAVAIQSSGRIVVAGSVTSTTTHKQFVGVVRYLGDHAVLTAGQFALTTGTTNVADPRLLGHVVATQTLNFSSGTGNFAIHGQVQEWVEQETGSGTLDFYYRIVDSGGPAPGIGSLLASNFNGFTTYVDYRPDSTGTIAPVYANRSTDNKSIDFTFLNTPDGGGFVSAGKQSYALLIKTNATNFDAHGSVVMNNTISLAGYEPAVPTAGQIDSTFGDGGFAGGDSWSPAIGILGQINGVLTQSNGKIIAGSSSGNSVNLARFTSNGDQLDTTFGTNGFVRNFTYALVGIGAQSNGDIITAGNTSATNGITIQRYTPDGKLDSTFATGGTASAAIAGGLVSAEAVKVLSNDKILIAGLYFVGTVDHPFIMQFTAAGKLDATFGNGGVEILDTLPPFEPRGIAIQSNGDILIGGAREGNQATGSAVVRLFANGTLDTSFGNAGVAVVTTNNTFGFAIAAEADDSILVGGAGPLNSGMVAHFSANGVVDAAFGAGGSANTAESVLALLLEGDGSFLAVQGGAVDRFSAGGQLLGSESIAGGNAVALQTGGKFVVGGNFGLARVTPVAALDTAFGRYGIVNSDLQGFDGTPTSVVVQKDGKILVAGSDNQFNWYVDRYNADGSLDTTFGSGGEVLFPDQGSLNAMVLDSSGRILLAGDVNAEQSQQAGVVERLNANGSIDTTFGVAGLFTTPANAFTVFNSIAVQSDGKIVVGGQFFDGGGFIGSFNLERLLSTGKLDTSFGTGGVTKTTILNVNDAINSVAIQKDGKIVVGGTAFNSSDGSSFVVARYTSAGKIDTTFGTAGKTVFNLGQPADDECTVSQVAIDSQGRIVVGANENSLQQGIVFCLTLAGKVDTSFATGGIYDVPNTDSGTSVDSILVLPGDKILIGGATGIFFGGGDDESVHPDLGGVAPVLTLAQIDSTGLPDLNFGTGGLVVDGPYQTAIPGVDAAHAMALQTDGKIVVAGVGFDAGVVRFTGP